MIVDHIFPTYWSIGKKLHLQSHQEHHTLRDVFSQIHAKPVLRKPQNSAERNLRRSKKKKGGGGGEGEERKGEEEEEKKKEKKEYAMFLNGKTRSY